MEELEQIDLSISNQEFIDGDNKKIDLLKDDFYEVNNEILIKDDGNQEKSMTNETEKLSRTVDNGSQSSNKIKSYKIPTTKEFDKRDMNPAKEYKGPPKVELLIPIPPSPKYNYLKKWLFRK